MEQDNQMTKSKGVAYFRHAFADRKIIKILTKFDSSTDRKLHDCMFWQRSIWNEIDRSWWRPLECVNVDGMSRWTILVAEHISDD